MYIAQNYVFYKMSFLKNKNFITAYVGFIYIQTSKDLSHNFKCENCHLQDKHNSPCNIAIHLSIEALLTHHAELSTFASFLHLKNKTDDY